MDFRAHYQNELEYLLEVGRAFSSVHAQASHLAQRSGDPDVERLLEGFAFLAAKIHARLDQAQPALAQTLAQYLTPQHLHPIPSCAMIEFEPDLRGQPDIIEIPARSELWSRHVQGVPVRFETTQAVQLLPIKLLSAEAKSLGPNRSQIVIELESSTGGRQMLGQLGYLDLYFHGEPAAASDLHMAIARHCVNVEVYDYRDSPEETRPLSGRFRRLALRNPTFEALGFKPEDPLLPWGERCLVSHRFLAEYQTLPEKFRQLRLHGLSKLALEDNRICLVLELNCPTDIPGHVSEEQIRLFTVPARNTFQVTADPLAFNILDRPKRLRASGLNLSQVEIYDVGKVEKIAQGRNETTLIPSFFEFEPGPPDSKQLRYSLERKLSPLDQHLDTFLKLHNHQDIKEASRYQLAIDLRCTNRRLAEELHVGDINTSPHGASSQVKLRNITPPTQPCAPPLQAELQWRLHASIALNRVSLTDATHLRAMFALYNHQGRLRNAQGATNQHLSQAIRSARTRATTRVVKGAPVRGIRSMIELDQRHHSDGQAFLLAQLVDEVLAAHTCLNGVHETHVTFYPSGHDLMWPPRSGDRVLSR